MRNVLKAIIMTIAFSPIIAQAQHFEVRHLGHNVNSRSSECSAIVIGDSLLLYATTQPMTSGNFFNSDYSLLQVYQAPIDADGHVGEGTPCTWGMNNSNHNIYNLAYDSVNQTLYFTQSESIDSNSNSEIYSMHYRKGKWQKPKKVGGDVNMKDCTNTNPAIQYNEDGTITLYYSSNREGGCGGMDIWYSIIENGKPQRSINLGMPVNSTYDEVTPFYDNNSQTLFFSQNCECGFGGFDILKSEGSLNTWKTPVRLPEPINSAYNDLYFVTCNSLYQGKLTGFLASNREDSYFSTDTACCNDIYQWHFALQEKKAKPTPKPRPKVEEVVYNDYVEEEVKPQPKTYKYLLPIKLYFHNDEPDPKSKVGKTDQTYYQTYNRYMFLRQKYIDAQNSITDSLQRDSAIAAINTFFDEEVHDNCSRFERFIDLIAQKLMEGYTITLTVNGYASPLHTSNYNKVLSQRRIETIINQFRTWRKGILQKYIDHGALKIIEVSYGSSTATQEQQLRDYNNQLMSVYSVDAAYERRIEIVDYEMY